ncbi:unnamed protein product [Prorocentrum cordatum]|uniref:Uncharacterized protein n=1 Tax=Prorocentrum cordatum TaxID=2364126 RepID=A0ABN9TI50_9DINO|nr:unnamed protein product [Polarella glacialis]
MFCLKFPIGIHPDWIRQLGSEGLDSLKRSLLQVLAVRLHVPTRTPEQSYRFERATLDAVTRVLALMDTTNFLSTNRQEWERILRNEGVMAPLLSRIESKMVAWHVKKILSASKADAAVGKKPTWRA